MGGTKRENEQAQLYVCNTAYASASNRANSLDGIDTGYVVDRALARVRSLPGAPIYEFVEASVLPPVLNVIIAPLVGAGRWILLIAGGGGGGASCTEILGVNPEGTGPYPTIQSALDFANANASAAVPYVVSLCPGVYTTTAELSITNEYVALVAEQPETVTIQRSSNGTLLRITAANTPTNPRGVLVRGIFFQPNDTFAAIILDNAASPPRLTIEDSYYLNVSPMGTGYFMVLLHAAAVNARRSGSLGGSGFISETDTSGTSLVHMEECVTIGAPGAIGIDIRGVGSDFDISHYQCVVAQSASHDGVCIHMGDTATNAHVKLQDSALDGGINAFFGEAGSAEFYDSTVQTKDSTGADIQIQGDFNLFARNVAQRGSSVPVFLGIGGGGTEDVELDDCFTASGTPFILSSSGDAHIYVHDGSHDFDAITLVGGDTIRWSSSHVDNAATDLSNPGSPFWQLRERDPFTPANSADGSGATGCINWDEDFIYVRTAAGGWKRAAIAAF